jgi:hypothetical protein
MCLSASLLQKTVLLFSNIFNQCVTLKLKTHNTLNMLHLRQLCYCLMAITFCSFTNKGAAENFPKQYIVFSMPDYEDTAIYQIAHEYGGYQGGKIAVAAGLNLSYLSQKENEVKARVEYVLTASEKLNIPILMELEGINYWQAYPELWNWWDFSSAGYNPDNRKNVEWFSWSPDSATKIGWRNWGRQFRLLPMPNLSSPAYRHVAFGVLKNILDIISRWWQKLPDNRKYLLVGIQLGTEISIGINNWYYDHGNDLLNKPEADDPSSGLNVQDIPSRGVRTIGYAAVSTAGIAHSGILTEAHITKAVQLYVQRICKITRHAGFPRSMIFTHAGGWKQGESIYTVADNSYCCPCWSFYGAYAERPYEEHSAMNIVNHSNAPYFSMGEWLIFGTRTCADWQKAMQSSLSVPRLRYFQIRHWGGVRNNVEALQAVHQIIASDSCKETSQLPLSSFSVNQTP